MNSDDAVNDRAWSLCQYGAQGQAALWLEPAGVSWLVSRATDDAFNATTDAVEHAVMDA